MIMASLSAVVASAETYAKLNINDCNIIVTDAEAKILQFIPAKTFGSNFKIGTILTGGVVLECLAAKKRISRVIPEHIFGIKLKVIADPIFDESGQISGAVSVGTSMKLQDTLHGAAQSIAATFQQICATTSSLERDAKSLVDNLNTIKKGGEAVLSEVKNTDEILGFVSEVANNSNLLGLNAAIEAARAGDLGRGFSVVADEIRKMAANSAESVKNIEAIMKTIQNESQVVVTTIIAATEFGEQQAKATEEILAVMQQLTATASELEKIASVS
jgi:Methyl-accepting chemotaxis protein